MKCIKSLTNYCIEKEVVAEDKSEWFQYGIERRFTSILIGCPFFVLALMLTNFSVSVTFFLSFYYLRSRTNGFHAKSVLACLIISLLCESFFLTIFYYSLTPIIMVGANITNMVLVFKLAPFKASSFPLSTNEFCVIKRSARIRVVVLSSVVWLSSILGQQELSKGITTGVAMAVFLLSLAYILNGGKNHEGTTENDHENYEHPGI